MLDKRTLLKNQLDFMSDDIVDKLYNTFIIEDHPKEEIAKYFQDRNISKHRKMAMSISKETCCAEQFLRIIKNGTGIQGKDLINHHNIVELCDGIISKEFIEAGMNLNMSQNGVIEGDGEFIIRFITDNIDSSKKGDVPTKDGVFELKGPGGKLKDQTSYDINACNELFNNLTGSNYDNIFSGERKIAKVIKDLRDNKQMIESEVFDIMSEVCFAKFPQQYRDKNIENKFKDYLKSKKGLLYKNPTKKRYAIKDYINTDVILDAWMLMDMVMYQKINKWDYLLCITKDILGEYTIVSKELLMQSFEIIESTIKEKMITRASYGYNVKDGQFHAIKIKYDKMKG